MGSRRAESSNFLSSSSAQVNMRVHYAAGDPVPVTDGESAGAGGRTLEFRRTFRRAGEDGLRGFFLIKRGERWENPHPKMKIEGGYPWRRVNN